MRSGRWPTQAAINVLALGAWGGVTGIAVFMDGVRAPIIVAYLVIILSTVLFSFLVRAYRKRLNELHTVGSDLARRTFDLKASQAELHRGWPPSKVTLLTMSTASWWGMPFAGSGKRRNWNLRRMARR